MVCEDFIATCEMKEGISYVFENLETIYIYKRKAFFLDNASLLEQNIKFIVVMEMTVKNIPSTLFLFLFILYIFFVEICVKLIL